MRLRRKLGMGGCPFGFLVSGGVGLVDALRLSTLPTSQVARVAGERCGSFLTASYELGGVSRRGRRSYGLWVGWCLGRRLGQGLQPGGSVGGVEEGLGQIFQYLGVVDAVEQRGALLGHRGVKPFAGLT
jgi:hypothetical protein